MGTAVEFSILSHRLALKRKAHVLCCLPGEVTAKYVMDLGKTGSSVLCAERVGCGELIYLENFIHLGACDPIFVEAHVALWVRC